MESYDYAAVEGVYRPYSAFGDEPIMQAPFLLGSVSPELRRLTANLWRRSQEPKFVRRDRVYQLELEREFQSAPERGFSEFDRDWNWGRKIRHRNYIWEQMANLEAVEVQAFSVLLKSGERRTIFYTDSRVDNAGKGGIDTVI